MPSPDTSPRAEGPLGVTDIQAFVALLARRRWVVVLTIAFGVVAGLGFALIQSKVYVATALLRTDTPQGSSGDARAKLDASVQLAKTYTAVLNDRSFLTKAADSIGHGVTTEGLIAHTSAATQTDTELIKFSATGPSPAAARLLAQQVAEFGVSYTSQLGQATTAATIKELNDQITSLNDEAARLLARREGTSGATKAGIDDQLTVIGQRRQSLTAEIASLIPEGQAQSSTLSIVGPATASATPISPRPVFNTMIGLIFGAVIGIALAWVRDQLDRTVRTPGDVELASHRPILGVVPIVRSGSPETALATVFDSLRVRLSLMGPQGVGRTREGGRVFTITSTREWEGKSLSTMALGHAFARAGKSVLVIDADLRRKGASQDADALDGAGLAEVVVDGVALDSAVLDFADGLAFLPAGKLIVDPTSCLDSRAFDDLLLDLRGHYDLILMDTPPIRPVPDAALTATRSDAVIMVVRLGVAPRQELASTFAMLREDPPFHLIGSIVHSADVTVENYTYESARGAEAGFIRGLFARR